MSRFSPTQVRRYYEANTRAFVRHGQGGPVGAIHRAVWAPGVGSREQAFHYVDDLIVRELDALALDHPARVLDLGCGVGSTLTYLARERAITGVGVTLSPLQVRIGTARVEALGLAGTVRLVEADYTAVPEPSASADLAYAIESFVHGPSPARFFTEAARVLRPGGRLVVCDDMRGETDDPEAERTLAQFVRGWHVNSLVTPTALHEAAAGAGFFHLHTTDLTPWLETERPRDRAIALLTGLTAWLPWLPRRLAPLVGGTALQRALTRGWIAYHCTAFQRT